MYRSIVLHMYRSIVANVAIANAAGRDAGACQRTAPERRGPRAGTHVRPALGTRHSAYLARRRGPRAGTQVPRSKSHDLKHVLVSTFAMTSIVPAEHRPAEL